MTDCVHVKNTLKGQVCGLTDYQKCPEPLVGPCDRPEQHYYEQMAKEEMNKEE